MAILGSRSGSSEKLALPLMVFAFLAVGGFLYWLNVTAEPTEVAIVEAAPERASGASAILDEADFLADPGQYEGQLIEVTGARVSSRLGSQAFWIGPDDAPFLVKMGPEVMEAGTEILLEQLVVAVGLVQMMNDSTLSAWGEQGAFANEGDRIVAEFAIGSPFLEASSIEVQGGDAGTSG